MGTNYYTKEKTCSLGSYEPEPIHLGKSSAGWQFTFQYNQGKYYKNVDEMKEWTRDKIIVDEYGRLVMWSAFWELVDWKQKNEKLNHAKMVTDKYPTRAENKTDFIIDGYSFSDCYFS